MRRVVATVLGTTLGLVLLLSFKTHQSPAAARLPVLSSPHSGAGSSSGDRSSSSSGSSSASGNGSSGSGSSSSSSKAAARPARSRTVTGSAVDTPYGPVQVEVTAKSGRIVDIRPLQLPQDSPRDIEIDNYAVPLLTKEALAAQSARVSMVSGATYTSGGYLQSLQSALDKLHA